VTKALKDIRPKISVEAHSAIVGEARSRNLDECVVAREILEGWAAQRLHALNITRRVLASEGIKGMSGDE
jgi:hypothetical protein